MRAETTRDEYLSFETEAGEKHEFYDGQIFAMSGGSFNHAVIGLNVATELRNQLRGKHYQPMNSDMRVHTPSGLDTYPDISVFCGEPELTDNDRTFLNPVVVIEVLSPSTRNYDRGDKFWHYRSILGLTDYLLIDSESLHVEHHQRQGKDEWLLHEYRKLGGVLVLRGLEIDLDLRQLYEEITFH